MTATHNEKYREFRPGGQRPHLVDNFPGLQHVKPLGQGAVLYGGDVAHFVHDHWTQGLLLDKDPCRRQPVLQAPVLVDVKIVGEGPAVCGEDRMGFHRNDTERSTMS